jgi:hypothetical protein
VNVKMLNLIKKKQGNEVEAQEPTTQQKEW